MASHESRPGGGNKKRKQSSSNNGENNGSCCNCQRIQRMICCVCLRAGDSCNDSCSCIWCLNNWENKDLVLATARHKKGCNCRKSNCKKKYCVCFSAGVGCHSQCRCEGCMNEYGNGIIKDEQQQQQRVLTNNNNNNADNDVTVDNESLSSSQSHHPFADNDFFDQLSELGVDMVINEEDEAECYRQQMLLLDDNMNMPSNQVNHVPPAAPNYHQPLTPAQNTNMLLDDPDLQGPSPFLGSPFSYYDNNVAHEHSSVHDFSMIEPVIHEYKPQTKSFGDPFQQEAPSSSSGAINHHANMNMTSSSISNNAADVEVKLLPHMNMFVQHNNRLE